MQDVPLLISAFLRYADDYHSAREIASRDHLGLECRLTYATAAARAHRLAKALSRVGVEPGDRVATLATNHHRHFELFYGVSGTGAVLHTVNPRLFEDQIAYICQQAEDCILCFDPPFAELVARLAPHLRSTRRYVVLGDPADADEIRAALPSGMDVTDYETLIGAEDDAYAWPVFDEQTASSLTSGCRHQPQVIEEFAMSNCRVLMFGFKLPPAQAPARRRSRAAPPRFPRKSRGTDEWRSSMQALHALGA